MKSNKLQIITIMVLVLALCLGTVAYADTTDALQNGNAYSAVLNGNAFSAYGAKYKSGHLTNDLFVYQPNSANGANAEVWYVSVLATDLTEEVLPTTAEDFAQLVENGSAVRYGTHDEFLAVLRATTQSTWFVFAEADSSKTGADYTASFSTPVTCCYDNFAPVFTFGALQQYAQTIPAITPSGDGYVVPDFFTVDGTTRTNLINEDTAQYTKAEADAFKPNVAEKYSAGDVAVDKLDVTVKYLTSSNYADLETNWATVQESFEFTGIGIYKFRISIKDLAGNELDFDAFSDSEKQQLAQAGLIIGSWDNGESYVEYTTTVIDTGAPELSVGRTLQNNGVVAGKSFSAPSTTVQDKEGSSTTSQYKVYVWVGGTSEENLDSNWELIYDSEEGVVEGKESYYDEDENKFYTKRDYVGNGLKVADKVKEGEEQTYSYYFFKIVYTAQDAYGNVATGESYDLVENDSYFELLIKVVEEEVETTSQDVWKIVLICVSVLAAAGIVAVIFINPDKKNKKSSHYTVTEE